MFSHSIRLDRLFEFLEEMLVLQSSSLELLHEATGRAEEPSLKRYLHGLAEELESQRDDVMTAIRDLGGNPRHQGEAARIQAERSDVLLEVSEQAPQEIHELTAIENSWYSAIREDVQLTFLCSIGPFLKSVHAQDVLSALIDRLEENLHAREDWLEQTMHRLLLQRALRPAKSHRLHREQPSSEEKRRAA